MAALCALFAAAVATVAAAAPGDVVAASAAGRFTPAQISEQGALLFRGFAQPQAQHAVAAFDLRFASTDEDGSAAQVHAQLFVPLLADAEYRPVLVFGSGTTGIADHCAPSLEQPAVRRWGYYRANMLAYAGQGFITVFPDYLGFNDERRPQRYFSKAAEGQMMLDAARAVQSFFAEQGVAAGAGLTRGLTALPAPAVFTAGYSQGGHAALAAADLRREYAPEVPLLGAIGFGSTNNVPRLFREGPKYAPYIIYTYQQLYGTAAVDPARLLQERWSDGLPEVVASMCVDEFQVHYPPDGRDLFRPEFHAALHGERLEAEYPQVAAYLQRNETGLSGHGLPALIVQGSADTIAETPSQTAYVAQLRRAGSATRYVVLAGISHRDSRAAGFDASIQWMERLLRGRPAPNDDLQVGD